MKFTLAIPTSDKIHLTETFEASDFFKIINVESGKIIEESFLQNKFLKANAKEYVAGVYGMLSDCNYILTINCSEEIRNYFKERKKIVVPTTEKIITNAVSGFIIELTREDSNTCCCP
ncbi:MAG: hypothetical protein ABR968_14060 [Bacteroidales bacterium]|jgi:predicted Fe-Mo cluster-binding NifX family protein